MSRTIAAFIYRRRILLSTLIILGAIALAPGANFTEIDNDITAWFSREDPVYLDYERFRAEFGGTRSLIVALKADRPERLFSPEGFDFIERVTGDIERVQTVQRVYSLATATVIEATPADPADPDDEGGLRVRKLVDRDRTPRQALDRALADDLLRGDLVSDDGRVTAIVVSFDEDRIDQVRAGVIERIHAVIDPSLPQGVQALYNGSLEISETYNRITWDNQRKYTAPIFLLTFLAIYAMFRSAKRALVVIFCTVISVLWALGLYTLMGFTYNLLSGMLVPLIVVLAVSDDVHMMQHYDHERRRGTGERAFVETITHLLKPLLGASGTTALGMLSLATSQVVAVRAFGIGAAVGIMVDLTISIVLVPTLLGWLEPATERPPHEAYFLEPLRRLARFSSSRPRLVIGASIVLGVLAVAGMFRLRVDTNHINFFSKRHPLSVSADVIDHDLSGIYAFQVLLEGPADSMKSPEVLGRIEELSAKLRRLDYVKKVTSVADYVKRINRELNDGDPAAQVLPARGDVIAQELFVFALGDDGRQELERVAASDFSRAQITVRLASMSSDLVFEQIERAEELTRATFGGTNLVATVTGSGRLFSTLDHYLVTSQLSSFGTAFVTVFGVIFLIFRSIKFGVLTIVPNLFPVAIVLGLMGWLDISMNVATVMLASVALGVVDDDTIHFINRYRVETAKGASTDEAIERATIFEGRAALTTTLINSCGFAVLALSEYKPNAWFGGLLALTMAVAFLAEVFVLPATIKLFPGIFGAERVHLRQ